MFSRACRVNVLRRESLGLVVRYVHNGSLTVPGNGGDLHPEALAQISVQIGEWLVTEQEPRPRNDRTSKRHTLLLPARQFVGISVGKRREPDLLERALGAPARHVTRQVAPAKRVADVADSGEVWPQRVVLKDHREIPPLGREMMTAVADEPAAEANGPAIELLDTCETASEGGLAGARRSQQHEKPSCGDVEIHARQDARLPVTLDRAADLNSVPCRRVGVDCGDAHGTLPRRRHPAGASSRKIPHASATTASAPRTAITSMAVPPAKS